MKRVWYSIRNHSTLLVLLIPLFLIASQHFPLTALTLTVFFYWYRVKDISWLAVLGFCLIFLAPWYKSSLPTMQQGRVISVKKSYIIVQEAREKIILYTDQKPVYDSIISFSPEYQKISSSSGFYRFDFSGYCRQQGIYYASSIDSYQVLKDSHSFRGTLMKKVLRIPEEKKRERCLQILFGIRSDENTLDSFLKDSGFSIAGVLILLNQLLKYFLDEKKEKNVMLVITIFFCVLTHCAYLPWLRMITLLLSKTKLLGRERTSFAVILSLLLHPEAVLSASFLLPAVFRLVPLFTKKSKLLCFTLSMCIQSFLFQAVNPLQMLLYRWCISGSGILWLCAFLSLFFPIPLEQAVQFIDHLLSLLNPFVINGSMLGPGMIFFFLLALSFRKSKHFTFYFLILFLFFDLTGFFHPFAEVVFINVGQGDSIYLQEPFAMHSALIDTGKPNAWNSVNTMLKAHGGKLDTLIITHGDNDHSGNQQNVIDVYHPRQVVTAHQRITDCGRLRFYDLNEIRNDDENQSSIVSLVQMNHIKLLLMGDADTYTEKQIIRKYGNLHTDVLKLSHHGSKTGSSEDFLNQIKPSLGIISCGDYSLYHHPSKETLNRLKKRHIPYLDTKTQGDIAIFCIGPWNLFLTSEGKIGFIT